jgi:energy-coupling factor transport system permease protein
MSIAEYVPGNSVFHRMKAMTKLIFVVAFFIVTMVFFKTTSLLILLLTMVALWRISKLPMKFLKLLMILVISTGVTFLLIQGFLYDPPHGYYTVIFTVPLPKILLGNKNIWDLTLEGVLFGVAMTIKMMAVIFVFPLAIITTSITDFVAGLTRLKIPYKFSFTLAIALRMVPQVNSSFEIIQDAQKVRGIDIEKMGLVKRLRTYVSLLVPLVLSLLRGSDTMDIALESRGFGYTQKPTSIDDSSLRRIDYIALVVIALLVVWSVYAAFFTPYRQIIPIDVGGLLGLPPSWSISI